MPKECRRQIKLIKCITRKTDCYEILLKIDIGIDHSNTTEVKRAPLAVFDAIIEETSAGNIPTQSVVDTLIIL